jgi:hypothetical protein
VENGPQSGEQSLALSTTGDPAPAKPFTLTCTGSLKAMSIDGDDVLELASALAQNTTVTALK